MESNAFYLFTADIILFIHALFVVFLVFGLLLVFAGKLFSWSWVRNLWFRLAHLLGIFVVILQSWIGVTCPLTTWEMALRSKAGDIVYAGSFISYWLKKLLYYQAPEWVFIFCYTAFGLLVVVSWFWVCPRFSNTIRTH
jgi:glucan phosphoethanolaminetransferase (alkaline phosphatase superfamily)